MKKILVVNNDYDTMGLLKSWLEKRAYSVEFTANPHKVAAIVRKFCPELIIVDVMQKNVAIQLKGEYRPRNIPILLMTGYTLRGANNEIPANDTIEKPFNLSLLERKIESLTRGIVSL